jgi:dienelactone hydrolase
VIKQVEFKFYCNVILNEVSVFHKKVFLILPVILGCVFSTAQGQNLRSDLSQGLQALFNNSLTEKQIAEKIEKTLATKEKYQKLISGFNPNSVTWKKSKMNLTEFEFKSPLQVPGSKSNKVYGYLYTPDVPGGCDFKFPATLLVQHVADDLGPQKTMALQAARQANGISMIIFLPEYGPRKNGTDPKAPPFNGNLSDFKRDIFQSLVDLRVSYEILKRAPYVDVNQMQIGGLSLGAALTATMAGFDPVFDKYLIGLGGGDYGAIMTSYNHRDDARGAIRWALQNVKSWKAEEVREALYDVDAFTWAYNIRNKDITVLAAQNDEIFNYENNVMKLVSIYEKNGNKVRVKTHQGEHVPDHKEMGIGSALKVYWKVLTTILGFIGESQSASLSICAAQYN